MASAPNDHLPLIFPRSTPPMPAVSRILSRFDRQQVEGFIAVALDLLDTPDGEADLEADDPAEAAGVELDVAWPEWHGLRGYARKSPYHNELHSEDDEEDDPSGPCDEDGINTSAPHVARATFGPGCEISDDDHDPYGDAGFCLNYGPSQLTGVIGDELTMSNKLEAGSISTRSNA